MHSYARKGIVFHLLFLLGLFINFGSTIAKTYPANIAQLNGTSIVANAQLGHSHQFFTGNMTSCTTGWQGNYDYTDVRNIVTLSVNDGYQRTIPDTFTVKVKVLVEWKDASCVSRSRTVDLQVKYDTARGVQHRDRHAYTFTGGNYVRVTVISIVNSSKAKYLTLRSSIEVTRFGRLDPLTVPTPPTVTMGADTLLRISWPSNTLAEEYDLEWTWVDNYDITGDTLSATQIAYNFRFNSSRVTLDTVGYAFQPIYERGWLLFRVRAVGRAGTDFTHRVVGRWSNHNILPSGGNYFVSGFTSSARIKITADHRASLNWQYTKTFTENAKFKEVIAYADGMLRSRQHVTRIESVNMAVVNEDVYDYSGRKAVSVMPTPVFNKRIDFYQLFNTKTTGVEYKSADFDSIGSVCKPVATSMSSDKGATKYYSTSNPYATSPPPGQYWHRYIPQSHGYPYALTTYMPDPTGRIREQGGLGAYHQPSGTLVSDTAGHTTKYFYGTPSQPELDALFGNAVGYNMHYESKMVIDPQGSATISYTDLKGKVIATSLVGDVYTGYDTLSGYGASSETMNIDFNDVSPSVRTTGDDAYTLSTSHSLLLPNQNTVVNLTYQLQHDTVAASCLENVHCNDCVYELYLSVKDQCGKEQLLDASGSPAPVRHTLGKAGDFSNWCATMSTYNAGTDTDISSSLRVGGVLQLNLPRGSYTFTREIRPLESAAKAFAQRVLDNSTCLPTLDELVAEEMLSADTMACFIDCQSCKTRLGDSTTFITKYVAGFDTSATTQVQKDSLIKEARYRYSVMEGNCKRLCRPEQEGECAAVYNALRTDFTPGGQFAAVSFNPNGSGYYTTDPYSVFNNNPTSSAFSYKHANSPLKNVKLWTGTEYKLVPDLTPNELFIYWEPRLEDSLVKIHPEYCQYTKCTTMIASKRFDSWLSELEDLETVKQHHYMRLVGTGSYPPLVEADSFFTQYTMFRQRMEDTMTSFSGGYSMYEVAVAGVLCNTSTKTLDSCLDSLLSDDDFMCDDRAIIVWDVYRSLYLAAKDGIVRSMMDSACQAKVINYAGKTKLFPRNIRDTLEKHIGLPYNGSQHANWGQNKVVAHCDSICKGYKKYWLMRLDECTSLSGNNTLKQQILDALGTVCKSGCNESNPLGVNGPSGTSGLSRFDSVLAAYNINCYGLTIDMPGYANSSYTLDVWPFENDCPCKQGCKIEHFGANGITVPIPTIHTDLSDYGCGCATPGEHEQYRKYRDLSKGISNGCRDKCYTCEEVHEYVDAFVTTYPTALDSPQLTRMLTSYLNMSTGLGKTWAQYLKFFEGCTKDTIYTNKGMVQQFLSEFSSGGTNGFMEAELMETSILSSSSSGSLSSTKTPPPAGGNGKLLDTCACNLLDNMYQAWLASGTGTFDNFAQSQVPGLMHAQAIFELCLASTNRDASNAGNTTFGSWSSEAKKELEFNVQNFKVMVPTSMTCDGPGTGETGIYDDNTANVKHCEFIKDIILNYRNQMHDSCWKVLTINGRTACRNMYMRDSLTRRLNKIYFGDPDAGYDLEFFNEMLKDCECNPIPPGDFLTRSLPGEICTKVKTTLADTVLNLLNSYINTDKFYVNNVLVKDVASHYFSGPLNIMPNLPLDNDDTKRKKREYFGGFGVPNKISATVHHWAMKIRDTTQVDTIGYDKLIDIFIYSANLSNGTWPSTIYLTSFTNPVLYKIEGDIVSFKCTLNYKGWGGTPLSTEVLLKTNYKGLYSEVCRPTICTEKFNPTANACVTFHKQAAEQRAIWRYERMQDSVYRYSQRHYMQKCYDNLKQNETFSASYQMKRHHVTLYYYDQAGNLVQTVPPAGVIKLNGTQVAAARNHRKGVGAAVYPSHTLRTVYRYTTFNQVYQQITPDADAVWHWYDENGRIIMSQNGDQRDSLAYSYTLYDALGRPKEAGKVTTNNITPLRPDTSLIINLYEDLEFIINYNGLNKNVKTEITKTFYDKVAYTVSYAGFSQSNLRKRVASITYQDVNGTVFDHATHYSYDIHGNVKELIQHVPALAAIGHNYKLMRYSYDLISNVVKQVDYQPGYEDAWHHKYAYDADNRITLASSSSDGIIWDRDAAYFYYLHGPLARVEIGEKRVQGMDYAYTLQGWLKGVNSTTALNDFDMGQDGKILTGNNNRYVARDVFGFTLGYYTGDYKAAGSSALAFESAYRNTNFGNATPDLYNGNISTMATALSPFTQRVQARAFGYDQLNRLSRVKSFQMSTASSNTWSGVSETAVYRENFSYDANGNILKLNRHGHNSPSSIMDSLTYSYYAGTNRLKRVQDAITSSAYSNDFDNHSAVTNYTYDKRGNLIADVTEDKTFAWNNIGKLKKVKTSASCSNTSSTMYFDYDAMGNRLRKKNGDTSEYYIRDAQGNTMAIYSVVTSSITLTSQHIYGSSRLGQRQPNKALSTGVNWTEVPDTGLIALVAGMKEYELTNHLGNVLATITDRRLQRFTYPSDTPNVQYYEADIVTAQDYYAFGSILTGRKWVLTKDAEQLQNQCVTCRDLRNYLKNTYTYSTSNSISPDSTTLTTSLNSQYDKCESWSYWKNTIYSTCKLWDSAATYVTPTPGVQNASINFGNTGSYTFGNGSFTVEAWIYPQAAGAAAVRTIAAKYHTNPSGEIGGFHLYLNAAGQLEFKVGDAPVAPMTPPGRQGIIRTTAAITFNAWTHVAAVRAGNNPAGWTLYVNGVAVPTVLVNPAIMPTGIIEQGSPDQLYIGGGAAAGAPNSWNGRLKKVRVMASALLGAQVLNHYAGGCGTDSSLIARVLDAPLNGYFTGASFTVKELALNRTGTITTAGGGNIAWSVYWRDSTCYSSLSNTNISCKNVLVKTGKKYRYGFNGQERDDEIYGAGNTYTATFWEYDARIGRRWNRDPKPLPEESEYAVNRNNPIRNNDPNGDTPGDPDKSVNATIGVSISSSGVRATAAIGASFKTKNFMGAINISATSYNSGLGTTSGTDGIRAFRTDFVASTSLTVGGGNAQPLPLNTINSGTATGVENSFQGSFTIANNLVLNSEGRNQRVGYIGGRVGPVQIGGYNDFFKFKGLGGDGDDRWKTGGASAQFGLGDNNSLTVGFDVFTGERQAKDFEGNWLLQPGNPGGGKYGTYLQTPYNQRLNNGQTFIGVQHNGITRLNSPIGGRQHMYSQDDIHNNLTKNPLFQSTANGL